MPQIFRMRRPNINRVHMENLFHKIFSAAQIDISIDDRFGNPVKPREWFLVPLHMIDEAVQRFKDGSISDVAYDTGTASFVEIEGATKVVQELLR